MIISGFVRNFSSVVFGFVSGFIRFFRIRCKKAIQIFRPHFELGRLMLIDIFL